MMLTAQVGEGRSRAMVNNENVSDDNSHSPHGTCEDGWYRIDTALAGFNQFLKAEDITGIGPLITFDHEAMEVSRWKCVRDDSDPYRVALFRCTVSEVESVPSLKDANREDVLFSLRTDQGPMLANKDMQGYFLVSNNGDYSTEEWGVSIRAGIPYRIMQSWIESRGSITHGWAEVEGMLYGIYCDTKDDGEILCDTWPRRP